MTINIDDWSPVEMKAQAVELAHVETPKVPLPTMAQQLNFVALRCGQLEARLRDYQRHILAAQMYFSIGATDRAQQEINKCILL